MKTLVDGLKHLTKLIELRMNLSYNNLGIPEDMLYLGECFKYLYNLKNLNLNLECNYLGS